MIEGLVRVLLVEDDEDDFVITRDLFAEIPGTGFELERAEDFESGLAAMCRGLHDVYLVDYRLGGRTGLELLRESLRHGCAGPVILLTGQTDWQLDQEALLAGAADYLEKAKLDSMLLARSIRYSLQQRRHAEELERRVRERTAELARANAALWEVEARLRQLADSMPQIVWTAGTDGEIDYMNQKWDDFTGLPHTSGNQAWGHILHPDDARPSGERWAASVRSGEPFEMEMRLMDRRQNAYRWHLIRTVAIRDEAGKVARWFGTATDIDGQKRAEESSRYLAEASVALAGVVDYESTLQKVANLAVPFFADWSAVDVANDDGTLRRLAVAHQDPDRVRLAHELMTDYPPDPESPGGAFAVLRTGQPELVAEITDDMLVQAAKDDRHLCLIRSLGLRSYLCVQLAVFGEPLGVLTFATAESGRAYTGAHLALATDLAHRAGVAIENTRLYQALRDADRRKDEFLATLAHELRNPLAPMRTAVELLRMKGQNIPELQLARDVIDRQTQAMTRLIDDLMDVSRINQGKVTLKREQIELVKIVQGAVETSQPLIEEMGHELTVTLPPRTVIVDADLTRLAQVILNLLNNAAKYTERGGRIAVRAELQGSEVVLSVTDTGIGIPADKLPTLFEMFSQVEGALSRSQGGLGIGLCLVKRLVEMHGGSVEAKSGGPGRGSEFVVRLPIVVEQTYPRLASQDGDKAKSISNLRILVVDDNRDAAQTLAMLIKIMGNNVHTAHDGEEAVAAAGKFRPDVVLCDIGLPKMNGYEACRRMKEQAWDKNMILIAVTGWGQDEDRRKSEEAGFDHHLVKPVDLNSLSNLLLGDPKLSHTPTVKSGPLRVLVVDDMRDARHMLSTLLKASGHDVQTASDGLTALSVALDFQPNVVLMDNSMPGMSGLEVAKQMRLEPKLNDAILIALTGHGDEEDRQRSLEAGFDHHLVKPANIKVIREIMGSIR